MLEFHFIYVLHVTNDMLHAQYMKGLVIPSPVLQVPHQM
jgi:hypothetical protein